jgi:hypothetical protein
MQSSAFLVVMRLHAQDGEKLSDRTEDSSRNRAGVEERLSITIRVIDLLS